MEENNIKDSIWQTIREMNRLWTMEGQAEALAHYFHERMIAITPSDTFRIEGRDACVAGWKGFSEAVNIIEWKEADPKIELYGNNTFAVVAYNYSLKFEAGSDTVEMKGRDMFSMVREKDKWWIVSDQFSSFPED